MDAALKLLTQADEEKNTPILSSGMIRYYSTIPNIRYARFAPRWTAHGLWALHLPKDWRVSAPAQAIADPHHKPNFSSALP
jgi:hypothetical protein